MFIPRFEEIDAWFSLLANVLTAFGILGLFFWWINRRLVKIHIRVPNIPDINYNMLYIRDGGEGSKIVNKIHSFKKLNSHNTNEEIISIKIDCKPQLGFQFKCFAEVGGNEKQKKEIYPRFRKELEYLGFQSIDQLAYDGKVWFLLPNEYLFGQIRASLVENIMNNIWYPTLAKRIYPYHSIIAKVPIRYDDYNLIDQAEYYLEVIYENGTKEEIFFGTLEVNEAKNYIKLKASVKIKPNFKPFKFRGIVKSINGKSEIDNIFAALDGSTANYKKITSEKIQKISKVFSNMLDEDSYSEKDHKKSLATETASELINLVRKNQSKIKDLSIDDDIMELDSSLNNFVKRNKVEKSFFEYAEEVKNILTSLEFKYDIEVSKIINDSTIEIRFDDFYKFKKEGDYYIWNPKIKQKSIFNFFRN